MSESRSRNFLVNWGRGAWALLRCSHPEPVLAVTAACAVLALAAGRGWGTLIVIAAVLPGQLFVGWTNDLLDVEVDRRAGRFDKPLATGEVAPGTVRRAIAVALLITVVGSLANGIAAGGLHLVAVGAATLYNRALKATLFSVLPYAFAFGSLPSFVTLGLSHAHLAAAWSTIAAAALGAGAHFTQALSDIESDRVQGVGGLPARLGPLGSLIAAALLLGGSALAAVLGPGQPGQLQLVGLALAVTLVGGIVLAGLGGRRRLAFRLTLAAAGAIALILVGSGGKLA